jgi:hypothetical protein
MRLGSDSSVNDVGWDVDDVMVQSCQTPTAVALNDLSAGQAQSPLAAAPVAALPAAAALAMAAVGLLVRRRR